ncbi:MAG: TolB family protein, partial [Syntrophothermus sp.]
IVSMNKILQLSLLSLSLLVTLIPEGTIFSQIKVKGTPLKIAGGSEEVRMSPAWSPDGNMLAFSGANYKGIYVKDLKTEKISVLTSEPSAGYGLKWSSDSKSILARVAKYKGVDRTNAVKIFDVKTKKANQLTPFRSLMPATPQWGNNDQSVCLYSRGKLEIFKSGKKAGAAANSRKKNLVLLKDDKLASADAITGKLISMDPVKGSRYLNPEVSPDGSKITFEVIGGNMYVMNADGSGLTDLGKGYRPQWSPDSKYIVYMITEDDGHEFTSADIYVIKADGTSKQNLTSSQDKLEMNPVWSPDGSRIAFDDYKNGSVYVIEISRQGEE